MHYIPVCYSSKPASNIPVVFQSSVSSPNNKLQYSLDCFSDSSLPFHIFLLTHVLFSQFGTNYFTHVMYKNCQIPNNFHPACFSASFFDIFIGIFLYLWISVSSLIRQHFSHIIYIWIFIIPVPISHFAFFLSVSMQRVCLFLVVFPLWLRLGTLAPSSKWNSKPVDRLFVFCRSCFFRLPQISPTANLASLSTQLYCCQDSNTRISNF